MCYNLFMNKKKCSKCGEIKHHSEFHTKKSNKDGLYYHCKDCQREYTKSHYIKNKQYYIDKAKRNSAIKKDILHKVILGHFVTGCVDCGNTDIRVLEFDHLDNKDENVSDMLRAEVNVEKIKDEILKCDVVCANCHRIRTCERSNNWRSQHYASVYPHATNV